jgi:sporulation protein YabP
MDKEIASFNHNITVTERKNIVISGVKKIDNFNDQEFLLETTMGCLLIKGTELEIIKLDTYQGNVSIKGNFNNLAYTENSKKEKEDSFFAKLFK